MLNPRRISTPVSPDDVLGAREAAQVLRISERTLLKLAANGEVPLRKLRGQWRVRRGALLAWLDGRDPNTTQ